MNRLLCPLAVLALVIAPCVLRAQTVVTEEFVGSPPTAQPSPPGIILLPTVEARVGQAYTYQIASYDNPVSYGASGLPAGLRVDIATGLISGTPLSTGTFGVALSATNANGTGTATLNLVVGNELPTVEIVAKVPRTIAGSKIPAVFIVHRTGDLTTLLPVSFFIKGTASAYADYEAISDFVDIPANQSHVKIRIVPSDHITGDMPKSVKLVLQPESNYQLGHATRAKIKIIPDGE